MSRLKTVLPALALLPVLLFSQGGGGSLTQQYKETADKLIAAALADHDGYNKLAYLCDRIGNRLSGSPALEQAVAWAAAQMKRDGLENVVTPAVKVPHWVRGRENAEITAPVKRRLTMLALGGSVATPSEGITAEVVPVGSFDELQKAGRAKIAGKIVLFNVPYEGYGKTVQYRGLGASRAAALGAVAMLLRSVGSLTQQTPHTGAMFYLPDAPKVPAAAVTAEDALMIQRLTDAGDKVTVHLFMEAHMEPDADSANVIGEIRGREKPEEIVVMGGHLDSWDVGQGAQDNGSGCIASLQAVALIKKLGLRPRRTLRVVFFTNEENGLAGGRAYRDWAGARVSNHVAAIEMDGGAEKPLGFGFGMAQGPQSDRALVKARQIGRLLQSIGADSMNAGGGGGDISPLMEAGVPGFGMNTVGVHYFDWHHTPSDTIDKIKPEEFQQNIAALAVLSYVLADMPDKLVE